MKFLLCIVAFSLIWGCKLKPEEASDTKTDLGKGNEVVSKKYKSYLRSAVSGKCRARGTAPRVMVTGFNVFQGASFNISGTVAMSMADANFWPSDVKLDAPPPENIRSFKGRTSSSESGGRAITRRLTIDGKRYQVCFLLLDVQWDLAAAIIMHEAKRFRPKMIIMSGLNPNDSTGLTFESGAVNKATKYGGFESDGQYNSTNMPVASGTEIVPGEASSIAMTWDAELLKSSTESYVKQISSRFVTRAAPGARPSNDYICNNVSYVVLAGHKGSRRPLPLAGGLVKLERRSERAKIGFIHYPGGATDNGKEVYGWARAIAKAITVSVSGESADRSDGEPADIRKACSPCTNNRRYCGDYDFTNKKWQPAGRWEDCTPE